MSPIVAVFIAGQLIINALLLLMVNILRRNLRQSIQTDNERFVRVWHEILRLARGLDKK